jgi:hypothetical protein
MVARLLPYWVLPVFYVYSGCVPRIQIKKMRLNMKLYNSLLLSLYLIGTSVSLAAQPETQSYKNKVWKIWKVARIAVPASLSVICAALAYI